jgi:protein O-GlcNAc transferase
MANFNPSLDQALKSAIQHHQAGRLAEAEALYRQILQQNPGHAEALHLLGVLAAQVGRGDVAVNLIRQAIALQPNYPEALTNLGKILRDQGKLDEAIAACRQAIALNPNDLGAYNKLGVTLWDQGQLDAAIATFRQALIVKPDDPEAWCNLGVALRDQGQLDEAIAAHRQAIVLNPQMAEAHYNLGNELKDQGQLEEAIAAYRQAISLKPDLPDAHHNLGLALSDQGELDAAIAAFRHALTLKPNLPEAHSNLGVALGSKGQLEEAIAAFRKAIALKPNYPEAHSNLLYTLHFHPGFEAEAIAEEHRRWNRQYAEPLQTFIQPHANERQPERRLRIGYVSPDFRAHPVGSFLLPLLTHHDKREVEVFAYSQVYRPDAVTPRLAALADNWRSTVRLSDAQTADLIRQDRIDILVDLTMHMAHNRLLVFARKPAPVQVTYLAYCASTGLETIDFRLSDPYLDPPGMDESIYSEQTIRLPETYWCYQPVIDMPEVGPLPALARKFITFGCLNNFCKINEPLLRVWAQLLRMVPQSQLLLHARPGSHRRRVHELLEREGVDSARMRFADRMPYLDYCRLYNGIDIALDTFPHGGGTTTCDGLWMGVPAVSLVGRTGVGRGGLSILTNLGLPELAARSEAQYVQIAKELADDLPRLSHLRSTLRSRMKASPLMDASRFARNMEAAYRQMWRTWCARTG